MNIRYRVGLRKLMVAVCLIAVGLSVAKWLVYGPSMSDRLAASLFGHDTEYAPGFTQERWNALRVGMNAKQVETLLGTPFVKRSYRAPYNADEVWFYTRSPGDTNHFVRSVVFEEDVVTGRREFFHVD